MYDRIGHLNAVLYSPNKKAQLDAYTAWIASADEEITSLRARLEQAERERDAALGEATGFSVMDYHDGKEAGFRAGIEAAAKWLETVPQELQDRQIIVRNIRALAEQTGGE